MTTNCFLLSFLEMLLYIGAKGLRAKRMEVPLKKRMEEK